MLNPQVRSQSSYVDTSAGPTRIARGGGTGENLERDAERSGRADDHLEKGHTGSINYNVIVEAIRQMCVIPYSKPSQVFHRKQRELVAC